MGMLCALTMTLLLLAACTPLASGTDAVSCFLRGGVAPNVRNCDTGTAFSTFVLSKTSWTDHHGVNCYPDNGGHGASWSTDDLSSAQHQRYTVASCKAACNGNQHCNAITVGVAPQIPSLHLPPLVQRFRPPQQTLAQATAHATLETKAKADSEAARAWVISYLGGSAVRKHLDASLQQYNGSQLLEMFEWEFERLQLFHNAPLDGADADREAKMCCPDDTPLDETLNNGYLQQPCQRYVMGGGQPLGQLHDYQRFYTDLFGLDYGSCGVGEHTTLQQANNCMLFNANNLCKSSIGSLGFGGVTYVLNTKRLRGRLIFEPADAAMADSTYRLLHRRYPALGTEDAFLHLLQPHEELFGMYKNRYAYKTIAAVLNRWWVPGTPNPAGRPGAGGGSGGAGGGAGTPWQCYFEVMSDGNVWLPEDVLAMIAKHTSDVNHTNDETRDGGGKQGVWGTVLGKKLQDWNRQHKRPLIWADGDDTAMLLDPTVDGLAKVDRNGSKTSRFTDKDRQLFAEGWANGKGFGWLVNGSSPHLRLTWPSWQKKHVCHAQDASMRQFVLGVDGNNDCVYWEAPALLPASAPTGVGFVAKASAGAKWECLNDGACVPSNSSRAVFPTEQACLSGGCGTSFTCIKDIPSSAAVKGAYCLPLVPMQPGGESRPGIGNYTSLESCSKACYPYWDRMTECLKPPSGGMPSAYAVCGIPFGVEAKTGIYIKTQHNCSGQPVYQKGGANGSVLHRCNCYNGGGYDAGWCVSDSSQINDCSCGVGQNSDHFMDNAACNCVRPDAQQCNGQWRGLYDGDYWQAAPFVTVVPVDPTTASEPYFLPGGNCQFGNDAPVFAGLFERFFAGLFVSPWWLASLVVALAVAAAAAMRATVLTCRQYWETPRPMQHITVVETDQVTEDNDDDELADPTDFLEQHTRGGGGGGANQHESATPTDTGDGDGDGNSVVPAEETEDLGDCRGSLLCWIIYSASLCWIPIGIATCIVNLLQCLFCCRPCPSGEDSWQYQALDDETPAQIAAKLMLDLDVFMQLNTPRYAGLKETSRLLPGTVLLLPDAYPAVSASPTPPEGLLCAGCGMGGPGVNQQSLPGPSQSVARRVVDHQLESPLLHRGGGDDDNSSSTTSGSRGLLTPSALVGGDGDGAGAGYVELPGGSIINLQGEVSSHGVSSPLGTEQIEKKKRVVNSTKSRKESRQELQRRRARLRNLYCLVAGVGLAIALLVCYLTLPPPMTAMVKVINPDAKSGCTRPAGCEVTAIYVRLNVSKTCYGAPIYQDERGNVLYKCSQYQPDPCTHQGHRIQGWCTGPIARIDDCCGGCCPNGDIYLANYWGNSMGDDNCASATRPDLCSDGNWGDCARWNGKECPHAPNVTVEFV